MNDDVKLAMEKFKNAFEKLNEGVKSSSSELEKDGVIQRFEFTFELLWKTLKIILNFKGIIAKTPRDCLQEAFKIDLIEDESIFLDMMEDRNKTSHIYDKETSEEIFNQIKKKYVPAIANLHKKIEDSIKPS